MAVELLRASRAARGLELSTKDLPRFVYDRQICFVRVDGSAHIPADVLDVYLAKVS